LIGVWLSGKSVAPYLAFPPIPSERIPANFSWPAFGFVLTLIVLVVAPFLFRILHSARHVSSSTQTYRFPVWGWCGVIWLAGAWVLAWTRFEWFAALQEFTFTPLWLGYIVVINALAYQRSGRCMLTHRSRYLLMLFPLSAVLWWSFEYLNRFAGNWHYVGISEFGAWHYFVFATLPFSTVLPAVLGTSAWLMTFPRGSAGLHEFGRLKVPSARPYSWSLIGASILLLMVLGVWPQTLYPLVWLAPLALIIGLSPANPPLGSLKQIGEGDWRQAWCAALACLICGVFWEMWNVRSLAHWEYTVPYVQRFHVFEMPLLGYAGYLPFGLICVLWVQYILADEAHGGWWKAPPC
jgi:hypothetical protein